MREVSQVVLDFPTSINTCNVGSTVLSILVVNKTSSFNPPNKHRPHTRTSLYQWLYALFCLAYENGLSRTLQVNNRTGKLTDTECVWCVNSEKRTSHLFEQLFIRSIYNHVWLYNRIYQHHGLCEVRVKISLLFVQNSSSYFVFEFIYLFTS